MADPLTNAGKALDKIRSALEAAVNPKKVQVRTQVPGVNAAGVRALLDDLSLFGAEGSDVRAIREALHTREGREHFLTFPPDRQERIIKAAAEENRAWADDLRSVQENGVDAVVTPIHDPDAPATQAAQIGKDDPQAGEPSPKETGRSRRLASDKVTRTLVAEDGTRSEVDFDTDPYDKRTGTDRLDEGVLPKDIMAGLREAGLIPRDGQNTSDVEELLNLAMSHHKTRLDDAIAASPNDADNIIRDPLTHGGLLTDEELSQLRAIDEMDPKEAQKQRLSIIRQRSEIANSVADRLRNEGDDESVKDLMERAAAWQSKQSIRKPTGEKGLQKVREGFNMEPNDESQASRARRMGLQFGGTSTKGGDVVDNAGGIIDSDGSLTGSKSKSRSPANNARTLLATDQRKGFSIAEQAILETNPDGTLKYPHEAFRTVLQMASRLEENTNWHSVGAAISRVETIINSVRKASGLRNVHWQPEMVKLFEAALRKEGKVDSGVSANAPSFEAREKSRKATDKALGELLKATSSEAMKTGIGPRVSGAKPADMSVPAATETSAAGELSPGTSQNKASVPDAASNVRGRQPIPQQRNLETGELVSREMTAEQLARHEQWSQLFTEAMNTGDYGKLSRFMSGEDTGKADVALAEPPKVEAAAEEGPLPAPPPVIEVQQKPRRGKKAVPKAAEPAPAPAPAPAEAPKVEQPAPAATQTSGESEITAYVKKKGRDAAVQQFGEEAVKADGQLIGNRWMPYAKKQGAEPVSSAATAERESVETAKQQQGFQAERDAAAAEAAKTPSATEFKEPAPAERTLPADAPSRTEMEGFASSLGIEHEGLSDLDLYDALDARASELRKENPDAPFQAPGLPKFMKRKMRSVPGDVKEGENALPPVPEKIEIGQSKGDLAASAGTKYRTGRVDAGENSTEAAPNTGLTTSPKQPPAKTTTGRDTEFDDVTWENMDGTSKVPSSAEDNVIDAEFETHTNPLEEETGVPRGSSFVTDGPEDTGGGGKGGKPTGKGRWKKPVAFGAAGTAIGIGLYNSPPGVDTYEDIFGPGAGSSGVPVREAIQTESSGVPGAESTAGEGVAPEEVADIFAPSGGVGAGGPEAINTASGGSEPQMSTEEIARINRALKSVSAARMYGYGQYGPAY